MALDGITLGLINKEISQYIIGSKVEKIYQPSYVGAGNFTENSPDLVQSRKSCTAADAVYAFQKKACRRNAEKHYSDFL